MGGSATVASIPLTGPVVNMGSRWVAANSGLGATTSKFFVGGSVGLGYTETSSWIIKGKAPTAGERIAGFGSGGIFGSGLVGLKVGSPIVKGAVNGGLGGASQSAAGQGLDIRFFGRTESFSGTDVVINTGIGVVAGGFGGSVQNWYSYTPSMGNSQSFGAGWNYGIRTQINTAPATWTSTMVQAHGDIVAQVLGPRRK